MWPQLKHLLLGHYFPVLSCSYEDEARGDSHNAVLKEAVRCGGGSPSGCGDQVIPGGDTQSGIAGRWSVVRRMMRGKCLSLRDASGAQSWTLRSCGQMKKKKSFCTDIVSAVQMKLAGVSCRISSTLWNVSAEIHLQQRALWMFSIYSSWLRFLKGIRGLPRKPCSVFRGGRPIFSHTPLTGNCSCESSDGCNQPRMDLSRESLFLHLKGIWL